MTGPVICSAAVELAAAEPEPEPSVVDALSVADADGAADEENSTRLTWMVRFRRTRWESTDPVVDSFCTRLKYAVD